MFDAKIIKAFYAVYQGRVAAARMVLGWPMTFSEKIFYSHLFDSQAVRPLTRLEHFGEFHPDRVAIQDGAYTSVRFNAAEVEEWLGKH